MVAEEHIEALLIPLDPDVQKFFLGKWLERFVRQVVEAEAASDSAPAVTVLANAQVILPNGDHFELDLLADVGGTMCWIETKTGNYQQYVQKYADMARRLGLGAAQSFLVLADPPSPDVCADLSRRMGMTVRGLDDFPDSFRRLRAQTSTPSEARR